MRSILGSWFAVLCLPVIPVRDFQENYDLSSLPSFSAPIGCELRLWRFTDLVASYSAEPKYLSFSYRVLSQWWSWMFHTQSMKLLTPYWCANYSGTGGRPVCQCQLHCVSSLILSVHSSCCKMCAVCCPWLVHSAAAPNAFENWARIFLS